VPEGTVKRRLHDGREELKKGITRMENFTEQSYHPITLQLSHSGNWGRNKEPVSLIQNDLLAQNILWAAYQAPVTAEEIARALGTPAAYVEPVLKKLTDGELMKQKGNKYYTDFLITTPEQQEKYIPAQIDFVKEHFESLWAPIRKGLNKLREQDFYKNCNFDQQNSLEMYFAFNCLDFGLDGIQCDLFGGPQEFPPRGDGGCWIAFARVDAKPFDPMEVLARVRSQLRRYTTLGGRARSADTIVIGGVELDDKAKTVTVDGEPASLTPMEFNILRLLMQHPGRVFSSAQIYEQVWNDPAIGSENSVAVHIRHLREKIEINPSDPRYLKVVWGQGYKIEGGK
jgi:DNA-binding winged helix-turn-helix (wHTH) protein